MIGNVSSTNTNENAFIIRFDNFIISFSDKVFVLGPRLDVPSLVKQSDCFLSTAIFEGQGIAALEAMALKKPVVAMACSGLRECIKHDHDGILVALGDEQAAATNVINVLKNPELANKLGNNGKQSVIDRFSSIEYARQFLFRVEEAKAFGPAPVTESTLAFIQGLLIEINLAHQRLLQLEAETVLQRMKRALWKIMH